MHGNGTESRARWSRGSPRSVSTRDGAGFAAVPGDAKSHMSLSRRNRPHRMLRPSPSALWRPPEEQRIAIALMDLAGFTASETGRITGSPRGTVLARVHRGRKRLARMLRGEKEVLPFES